MSNFEWAPEELRALLVYKNGKLHVGCLDLDCNALRSTSGKGAVLRNIEKGLLDSLLYCRVHGGKNGKFTSEQIARWPANHKQCKVCSEVLPLEAFSRHRTSLFGRDTTCRTCRKPDSQKDWTRRTREQKLLASAKHRAKTKGLPFDLELSDIQIPKKCPVLGVEITEENGWLAPSIDQIRPNEGYTKDNICIMSKRANTLKNNMTAEEALLVYKYLAGGGFCI